jgi:hypothetical protein
MCADQDPAEVDEDRALHGTACHACLLVAKTSCKARNLLLEHAQRVDTMGSAGAGFVSRVVLPQGWGRASVVCLTTSALPP